MPPIQSCLHCQFLSHVLKALLFNQNSPKMKLFLQKKCKIFKRWGLRPQTPKTAPPIVNFWLRAWIYDLTSKKVIILLIFKK